MRVHPCDLRVYYTVYEYCSVYRVIAKFTVISDFDYCEGCTRFQTSVGSLDLHIYHGTTMCLKH